MSFVPFPSVNATANATPAAIPLGITLTTHLPVGPVGFRSELVMTIENTGVVDVSIVDLTETSASAEKITPGQIINVGPFGYNGGNAPVELQAASAAICRCTPRVKIGPV